MDSKFRTVCLYCGKHVIETAGHLVFGHEACRTSDVYSNFTLDFALDPVSPEDWRASRSEEPGIWRFGNLLPVAKEHRISLGEGNTPLHRLVRLGDALGLDRLYLKDESRNPTWSQKDRLSAVSVSRALEVGARTVTVSSSGNHGASTAAYAARAGIPCVVFTLKSTPSTMKTFMQAYGALVIAMETPEARWEILRRCVEEYGWHPTGNSTNPPVGSHYYGVQGYKTIAFEIFDQLEGQVPDVVVIPTALGDVIQGVWRGFLELRGLLGASVPRLVAVEPSGSLTAAIKDGDAMPPRVSTSPTLAFSSATTRSTYQAVNAIVSSGGTSVQVADDSAIATSQLDLARLEGIYGEGASVTSLAALTGLVESGFIGASDRVVCVLTSSGLKDPVGTSKYLAPIPTLESPDLDCLNDVVAESYGIEIAP